MVRGIGTVFSRISMRFAIQPSKSLARVRAVAVTVMVDIVLVLREYFAMQLASNIKEAWRGI